MERIQILCQQNLGMDHSCKLMYIETFSDTHPSIINA